MFSESFHNLRWGPMVTLLQAALEFKAVLDKCVSFSSHGFVPVCFWNSGCSIHGCLWRSLIGIASQASDLAAS